MLAGPVNPGASETVEEGEDAMFEVPSYEYDRKGVVVITSGPLYTRDRS